MVLFTPSHVDECVRIAQVPSIASIGLGSPYCGLGNNHRGSMLGEGRGFGKGEYHTDQFDFVCHCLVAVHQASL